MSCTCTPTDHTLIVGQNQSIEPTVFRYGNGDGMVFLKNIDADGAACNPQPQPDPCPVRVTTGCDTTLVLSTRKSPSNIKIVFTLDGSAGAITFNPNQSISIAPQAGLSGPASPTNNTWTWSAGVTSITVLAGGFSEFNFRGGPVRLCSISWTE